MARGCMCVCPGDSDSLADARPMEGAVELSPGGLAAEWAARAAAEHGAVQGAAQGRALAPRRHGVHFDSTVMTLQVQLVVRRA